MCFFNFFIEYCLEYLSRFVVALNVSEINQTIYIVKKKPTKFADTICLRKCFLQGSWSKLISI
jgi:hypothetical protein